MLYICTAKLMGFYLSLFYLILCFSVPGLAFETLGLFIGKDEHYK